MSFLVYLVCNFAVTLVIVGIYLEYYKIRYTRIRVRRYRMPLTFFLFFYFYYTCPDFIALFLNWLCPVPSVWDIKHYRVVSLSPSDIKDVVASPMPEVKIPLLDWVARIRDYGHWLNHYLFIFFSYLIYFLAILASMLFLPFLIYDCIFPVSSSGRMPFKMTPQSRRGFHSTTLVNSGLSRHNIDPSMPIQAPSDLPIWLPGEPFPEAKLFLYELPSIHSSQFFSELMGLVSLLQNNVPKSLAA